MAKAVPLWPTVRFVEAPHAITPAQAWRLLLETPATHTEFARRLFGEVLDAWAKP